jgi:hypothetical protein
MTRAVSKFDPPCVTSQIPSRPWHVRCDISIVPLEGDVSPRGISIPFSNIDLRLWKCTRDIVLTFRFARSGGLSRENGDVGQLAEFVRYS